MGEVAYKPSLRVIKSTSLVTSSYNNKIAKRFGKNAATMVEWMRYSCNENYKHNECYSVYHTLKKLAQRFDVSMATVKRYVSTLKKEGILEIGKNYEYNCRQNTYTIGQKYFDIVGNDELSIHESQSYLSPNRAKDEFTSSYSLAHSDQGNNIYNIYTTKKNKTYSSGSARGEPFPDPSPAPEDVFFDVQEKIKAQEAPPAPPPTDPEPPYQPIPTPPQPQPLHAQELSRDEKREAREAYAKFVETYPRKSGTEKELKEAFLGPLRELGAEELLFRTEKYVEMFEKKGKSKDFYLGDTNFLKKGYKSDELMDFIASTPRYRVLHAPVEPEIPLSKEERELQKKIKAIKQEIGKTKTKLVSEWKQNREDTLDSATFEEKKAIEEKYKELLEKRTEGTIWEEYEYNNKQIIGFVRSFGFETCFFPEQFLAQKGFHSEQDWIENHPEMKALQEKKRSIEAGEEVIEEKPIEIEKTKPQEAADSQMFIKLPNTGGLLKRMP